MLGICISGVAIAPVPGKIETSVVIFDSNNISDSADGSNLKTKFYVLITFCVLVYSLDTLSFSKIGATKHSFSYSILLLDDYEFSLDSS